MEKITIFYALLAIIILSVANNPQLLSLNSMALAMGYVFECKRRG